MKIVSSFCINGCNLSSALMFLEKWEVNLFFSYSFGEQKFLKFQFYVNLNQDYETEIAIFFYFLKVCFNFILSSKVMICLFAKFQPQSHLNHTHEFWDDPLESSI